MTPYIGTATSRVDGRAKVTGAAKYAAEFNAPGLAHASVVTSTIAKGRIARIDASEALAVEGVIDVLTHENRPPMADNDERLQGRRGAGRARRSGRCTTTRSCSAASRSRWWSPKSRRSRASRRRWSGWNTRRKRTSRTCIASAMRPSALRLRKSGRDPVRAAEAARRRRAGARRSRGAPRGRVLRPDRASQPDGAVCLDGDLRGRTASSRSTTRPRACRTCSAICAACSA